jgi:uncharacterized protein
MAIGNIFTKTRIIISVFLFVVVFAGLSSPVSALDVPTVPTDIPIVDTTNTLTQEQKKTLADSIANVKKETSNQIAILMVPSLNNDSLEDYSIRVAREWAIGDKEKDNGVLLLIIKDDRKIRIEVGYGLEGALTDARSSQIIRNVITPDFRQEKYFEGISSGLNSIKLAIQNEYDPASEQGNSIKLNGDFWQFIFFVVFFGLIWLTSILARSKSWWAGGVVGGILGLIIGILWGFIITGAVAIVLLVALGLLLDRTVSANYLSSKSQNKSPSWWAGGGFGGGSGSGGGFGGFGGGSFGGGGSSGSW